MSTDLFDPETGEVVSAVRRDVTVRVKPHISMEDYADKLLSRRMTLDGREIPDPTVIAPPIGYIQQPTIFERVRDLIRSERLRQEAEAAGAESFEEADDFDVPDEIYPASAYEFEDNFDPPLANRLDRGSHAPSGGAGEGAEGENAPKAGAEGAKDKAAPAAAPGASNSAST